MTANRQAPRRARKMPSLLPREHGAYAELLFPLVTGLLLGRMNTEGPLLAAAYAGAFLVHEPLLVIFGVRGKRLQRRLRATAGRRVAMLTTLSAFCAALGVALAPPAAQVAALLPVLLSLPIPVLIVWKLEKTTLGEIWIALTFSSMLIPVALAGGVSWGSAGIAAAIWALAFVLATLTVRATIAQSKERATSITLLAPLTAAATAFAALFLARSAGVWIALLPTSLVALILAWRPPHARRLRLVGWSLAVCNVLAMAWILISLR